jgi:hypothetical protein
MTDRVIKVYIEMELVEGEHFNSTGTKIPDKVARIAAERSFVSMIADIIEDKNQFREDWVQSDIISPAQLGCGCIEGTHENTIEGWKKAHPDVWMPDNLTEPHRHF